MQYLNALTGRLGVPSFMSRDYFNHQLGREKSGNPLVKKFLVETLNFILIKNISNEADGIRDDIDWVGKTSLMTPWIRIECKERFRRYRDFLVETKSSVERSTPGWIYKSKADLLAYVWVYTKSANGKIMHMRELQKWWKTVDFSRRYQRRSN